MAAHMALRLFAGMGGIIAVVLFCWGFSRMMEDAKSLLNAYFLGDFIIIISLYSLVYYGIVFIRLKISNTIVKAYNMGVEDSFNYKVRSKEEYLKLYLLDESKTYLHLKELKNPYFRMKNLKHLPDNIIE